MISRNGGVRPRWRQDGKELFYVTAESKLAAVPIITGETFQAGDPTDLFDLTFSPAGVNPYPYAVSADGQRFLVITPEETSIEWHDLGGIELDLFPAQLTIPSGLGASVSRWPRDQRSPPQ